jgi:hypothetical protein
MPGPLWPVRASGVESGMLRRRLVSAAYVAVILIASHSASRAAPKGVLELFTSQGCSSCPPADKLLGEFSDDPSIIALSLPIDIWDYLGWKDTLALAGHSARQRAYAELRGDRQVYTPQIVVNGVVHVLGSDRAAIERAIAQTDRNAAVMSLPLLVSADGGELTVTIKGAPAGEPAGEVWLCPLATEVPVAIGRGENHGRTITYHNVVRAWQKLGEFSGADSTWTIPLSQIEKGDIDGAAVLVQEGSREKPGLILGAAFTPFRAAVTPIQQQAVDGR